MNTPENGIIDVNFEDHIDDEVEYHFNVDLEILRNRETGDVSFGWAPVGSAVSEIWREDAGYGEENR